MIILILLAFPTLWVLGCAQGACTCSGLILDADGTILTNAHTILACQRAQAQLRGGRAQDEVSVHVALQDGRVFEGRVVCTDRSARPSHPCGQMVWSVPMLMCCLSHGSVSTRDTQAEQRRNSQTGTAFLLVLNRFGGCPVSNCWIQCPSSTPF